MLTLCNRTDADVDAAGDRLQLHRLRPALGVLARDALGATRGSRRRTAPRARAAGTAGRARRAPRGRARAGSAPRRRRGTCVPGEPNSRSIARSTSRWPPYAAGSISHARPSRPQRTFPLQRSPCRRAGGSGGPASSAHARAHALDGPVAEAGEAGVREQRQQAPLGVERGPVGRGSLGSESDARRSGGRAAARRAAPAPPRRRAARRRPRAARRTSSAPAAWISASPAPNAAGSPRPPSSTQSSTSTSSATPSTSGHAQRARLGRASAAPPPRPRTRPARRPRGS